MSLRVILGRAGSGKTHLCLQEIKTKITERAEHPLVMLVPEQYTFQAEKDLIAVLGTGGIFQTEVLSFRRLAFRVFNEAGGITYPHIHQAGKCMILYRILHKMKDSLKVFANSADRQGFVNTIAELITELKQYHISPHRLEEVSGEFEDDNFLKDKLLELSSIYAVFEEALRERYHDSDDDLTLAAAKIPETRTYDGAEIWIDGFDGFTVQEYSVIESLLGKAGRISVSLCADGPGIGPAGGLDIFAPTKEAYHKLVKVAQASRTEMEKPLLLETAHLPRFKNSSELAHLERYLNTYPYQTYDSKTKDIALFSAANIFSEIEAAARDIIRQCRDQNMRFRDITVVAGNLDKYQSFIEIIFAEYGIPYFLDRKVEITNHPLVRLLLAMLDIFGENWSYEAVFRYLKTGLSGIEQEKIDRLENYVLACGIRGSRWTKQEEWTMSPDFLPDEKSSGQYREQLEEINRIRLEVAGPLQEFRGKTKGRRQTAEICTAVYDFLCRIGVPAKLEQSIAEFRQSGEVNLASEYAQVWNILMEVFDQIVEIMGDEKLSLKRFADILKTGLAQFKVGLIPASLDQVLVGSPERSKSHKIKALYVLGVNDGVFPSAIIKENILSDPDRAVLGKTGIELAKDTRTQAFDEQYLIYKVLTTSGNYLRLSWPIADQEGKTLRPSIIISRIRKLFPMVAETGNVLTSTAGAEELELITGQASAFSQMVQALRRKADGREISRLWRDTCIWFAGQEEWRDRCRAVRAAFLYKNIAPPISGDKVAALYGQPAYASVSRLERYTACPFAFYVQYGLGAKERKIYRFSPPDVGTFMHGVIEAFSRQVAEQALSWRELDKEWCEIKVSQIVDEMLAKMQGTGLAASKRYTALTMRLKRVLVRAVRLIAEHIRRSGFEPLGYEMDFSESGDFPPIVIELESGEKIHLVGRIDRVDALKTAEGTYLRIVDYKSNNKEFKLADVYYGMQIQLMTYLDAIWENKGLDIPRPLLPGGLLYFRIDDPLIRGSKQTSKEEIEQAIMKQLKMKGLILADVRLIREMDRQIDGSSLIIPARINKGGGLGRSSAASFEQFNLLRKYVRNLLQHLGGEIMRGRVDIAPYRKKTANSCRYCRFGAICQFDPARKENSFKLLPDYQDAEVWKLMEEKNGHE
ncbi:DNA helicase/exodeoxyribonuclease V, subunit B [Syntrophobotulus glycolicus DSM 8271]|uniref:ATP-dependent helicase/deoxyribonuclease subunit B n=1 Tax=Syntrophobotulus glycolicus (strain DSM 8271 / FlGlyR) TaxID=645991 RepID=F0SZ82_SYNGF|nr:helicase-exonuclease AddAB subunit AddB [Syntrophobotulus glycolicus]ADY57200.1 DNA helicase/exodeoxyribonuclease V, subunit B [Syntrophobotulus glycolicus DSM 8271]